MSDSSRFEGLLQHVTRHLGEVTHGHPAEWRGRNRGFAIGFHRHPEREMVSAASTGVRFQDIEARMPEEFVCSVRPGQDSEASYLVHVVADRAVQSGQGHEYGGGYLNSEPLIPDSEISGLAVITHPFAPESFNIFRAPDQTAILQFLTLIPITLPEHGFLEANGLQDLIAHWRDQDTDLLDIYRPSAV